MNKPLCVVSCAIDTVSGYGSRSRDIVKSLLKIKGEEWNIKILSQRWGNTPMGALDLGNDEDHELKELIVTNLDKKPEIWIQITIPSEFQPVGYRNIGITAGIETNLCAPSWIEGCNRMDVVLTSSEHSKRVFEESKYEQKDINGNLVNTIELRKPVEVLLEGCDVNKYFKTESAIDYKIYDDISSIPEDFLFLIVGHWLQGEFGEDRKNIGYTLKAFLEVFKNKGKKVALVIKTSQGTSSIIDQNIILDKINNIYRTVKGNVMPNIYFIHGEISDESMNCLYNHPKIKAMISLTKGEGFGRPLLEFSFVGKPIIASGWGGQLDFLDPKLCGLVGGKLDNVHPSAQVKDMLLGEATWFRPDDQQVGFALKDMYENYKKHTPKAMKLSAINQQNFNMGVMTDKLKVYLDKYIPSLQGVQKLILPKLKKIE